MTLYDYAMDPSHTVDELQQHALDESKNKFGERNYGGSYENYAALLGEARKRADMGFAQDRITPDATNFNSDLGLAGQSQNQQALGLGYYQAMANGGQNAGMNAYRQGVGNAMANQQSLAASSRGGAANAAAAQRLADHQRAMLAMGGVSQLGALQAQGQMAGYAGLANGANMMRQGSQAAQGLSSQWAQDQANAGIQQQQQDLQNARFYSRQAHDINTSNQQGNTRGMLTELGDQEAARALGVAHQGRIDATNQALLQAGGAVMGAGANLAGEYSRQQDADEALKKARGW